MKLLDTNGGNTKLKKTSGSMAVYRVAGLSLFPDDKLCPSRHIAGCAESCLESAGRGRMRNVIAGRQKKAQWFRKDQAGFLAQLRKELANFEKTCQRQGVKPAVRLNVLSDVQWERLGIPQEFPNTLFYDYSKLAVRLGKTPENYRLMFSYSGKKEYKKQVQKALKSNVPISAVFRGPMPSEFLGRPVIDGDESDLFNLFAGPVVVGLRAKGKAKTDQSDFVIDTQIIARG
ncbi:MAG: GP88 family protein [Rhodospirillales bacterium]